MKISFFSTKNYDKRFFQKENSSDQHELIFHEFPLSKFSATAAKGSTAICAFVNDHLDADTLKVLASGGTKYIAMRCAGFNNVDLEAAHSLGMTVVRVPAYSPHAVAEHTLAILLTLNRRIHRSFNRVREGNFSLEGLIGFDIFGLTVGIIGTGKIGQEVARIFNGLGCRLLCYDIAENEQINSYNAKYVSLDSLYKESDIITLHCPLTPETHHLINQDAIACMKDGVTILNTSRGALIDTSAVIRALKSEKIANLAIDVYEEEEDIFFEDQSAKVLQDDIFARLLTFPNVLVTGHQAFFTENALSQIAKTTLQNLNDLEKTGFCANEVQAS